MAVSTARRLVRKAMKRYAEVSAITDMNREGLAFPRLHNTRYRARAPTRTSAIPRILVSHRHQKNLGASIEHSSDAILVVPSRTHDRKKLLAIARAWREIKTGLGTRQTELRIITGDNSIEKASRRV